jgi:hypothetical protein
MTQRTIDGYLDAAIKRQGLKSDRDLARALGFVGGAISQWRTRRTWPADETMVRLADLAGMDPSQALLDLNVWRAHNAAVRSIYEKFLEKLAIILAAFIVFAAPGAARAASLNLAGTITAQINTCGPQIIYYATI